MFPISIHALREESDGFYSDNAVAPRFISIHALREESDRCKIKILSCRL